MSRNPSAAVQLTGGPLHGESYPVGPTVTCLRIPFRFTDGTIGRSIYEQSPASESIFAFERLLSGDGFTLEQAAVAAAVSARDAAETERRGQAVALVQKILEQRAAEDTRRAGVAEQFKTATGNAPEGIVRDLAELHTPDVTIRSYGTVVTCRGCDAPPYDDEPDPPGWPCRTATILASHLGVTLEGQP